MSIMDDGSFDLNFDEAIAPKGRDPIPRNVYPMVITDAAVDHSPKGWTMINVTCQVEGGDYDGRLVWDRWVMPNRQLQEPKKYSETLGYIQQRLEAIYNNKITGSQKLRVENLPGQRFLAQVNVKADAMKDDDGNVLRDQNGAVMTYDPKNEISKYMPFQATPAQTPQAVTLGVPGATPVTQPQPVAGPQPISIPGAGPVPQTIPQPTPIQQPQPINVPATAPVPTPVASAIAAPETAASPEATTPAPSEAPQPQAPQPQPPQTGEAGAASAFRL